MDNYCDHNRTGKVWAASWRGNNDQETFAVCETKAGAIRAALEDIADTYEDRISIIDIIEAYYNLERYYTISSNFFRCYNEGKDELLIWFINEVKHSDN